MESISSMLGDNAFETLQRHECCVLDVEDASSHPYGITNAYPTPLAFQGRVPVFFDPRTMTSLVKLTPESSLGPSTLSTFC